MFGHWKRQAKAWEESCRVALAQRDEAIDDAIKLRRDNAVMVTLNSGKRLPVFCNLCTLCDSEWFSIGYSKEWLPSFCPYCGEKFNVHSFVDHNPAQR